MFATGHEICQSPGRIRMCHESSLFGLGPRPELVRLQQRDRIDLRVGVFGGTF